MNSTILSAVEGQGRLPLALPESTPVDMSVIRAQTSFTQAIKLAIQASGKSDKQINMHLKIDPGHWSNILKGNGHFPQDKYNDLLDVCGNESPLAWWAWSRGKGLVMLESEAERQMRVERDRADTAERKVKYLEALVQGRA